MRARPQDVVKYALRPPAQVFCHNPHPNPHQHVTFHVLSLVCVRSCIRCPSTNRWNVLSPHRYLPHAHRMRLPMGTARLSQQERDVLL